MPYHFEVRQYERIEFISRSDFPVDVLLAGMADYEAWVSGGGGPAERLKVYTEALETVGHAIEFVAPEEGSYMAVLLNRNANAVDVAVEIRLSPAVHGRVRKL
jgi:hypothetical protein